jgi:hypothetical protein
MTVAAWTVKECQAEDLLAMEPVEALTEAVAAEEPLAARWPGDG